VNTPPGPSNAKPIRLLYDLSVLGAARANPLARTGVYRVVDSMARYMAKRHDVETNWTAYGNPEHLQDVIDLLRDDLSLQGQLVASVRKRRIIDAVSRPIRYLAASHLYRAVKPLLPLIDRMRNRYTFSEDDALGFEVLHSPFHSLPSIHVHSQSPVRILTVYDLIPIKFPHFFEASTIEMFARTIASLDKRDWALCISENTRRDLLEYRTDLVPQQVRVTPLAADSRFNNCKNTDRIREVRERLGIPSNARYFLSVCTLEPRKNLRHLISAFNQSMSQLDESTYLLLVGTKGWKIEGLLRDIALSSSNRVLTTGYVRDEDLAPLYTDAIAFVYPSLYEGFGLPPLEAMQCGTPVITSNNSSLPEVVGDAGLLVAADCLDELADAMIRLERDEKLREHLSCLGTQRAQQFSWERCGQLTVEAYRNARQSR
jgi:glycosyltransferase involved in cell wall biosynthesis